MDLEPCIVATYCLIDDALDTVLAGQRLRQRGPGRVRARLDRGADPRRAGGGPGPGADQGPIDAYERGLDAPLVAKERRAIPLARIVTPQPKVNQVSPLKFS